MSGDIDSLYGCRWNHQYQKKTFFGGDIWMDVRWDVWTGGRGDHMSHVNISPVIFQYSAMWLMFRCPNSISRRWSPGSTWDDLLASFVTTTDGSIFLIFFFKFPNPIMTREGQICPTKPKTLKLSQEYNKFVKMSPWQFLNLPKDSKNVKKKILVLHWFEQIFDNL